MLVSYPHEIKDTSPRTESRAKKSLQDVSVQTNLFEESEESNEESNKYVENTANNLRRFVSKWEFRKTKRQKNKKTKTQKDKKRPKREFDIVMSVLHSCYVSKDKFK